MLRRSNIVAEPWRFRYLTGMTPIVIKKYGNRRLYDTQDSVYITLEQLAEKVRKGADVRVVDAKTNEDLTQGTLTQIILESRNAGSLLPVPLLVQLIRMGDEALAEFLGRYVSAALELYLQAKQGAQYVTPFNPFAQLPFQATNAIARLLSGVQIPSWGDAPFAQPAAPQQPPASPAPDSARKQDVDELRRELDELKAAIRRKKS